MSYPIKTLSQLPLMLKGFRKEKGLTQAVMGEKLGITQQSYASFEANPTVANLDRLFLVLRLLDVDISLDQMTRPPGKGITPSVDHERTPASSVGAEPIEKPRAFAAVKARRIVAPTSKKENW